MRKSLFLLFISLTMNASATGINTDSGIYFGGQVNFGSYKPMEDAAFGSSFMPLSAYIRPYLGYRFNDYFALEAGYNRLVNDHYSGGDESFFGGYIEGPDHYRLYAIDFSSKFIYPFESGFSVFGKAGLAYAHQDVYNEVCMNCKPTVDSVTNKVLPLAGLGMSYNFNSKFATDVSYTHMFGSGVIGNVSIVGVGFTLTL